MKYALAALALLFGISGAAAQGAAGVSPGRLGVSPLIDPEPVYILDKTGTWVTIGSMTGGEFTPVAGGGGTFVWPGTAGIGTAGQAAPAGGTMPFVNSYLDGLLPAFATTPTFILAPVAAATFLSDALSDGAIVTIGKEADTAWSAGPGTVISILKKISANTAAGGGGGTATTPFVPGATPIAPFTATSSNTTTAIPSGSTTLVIHSSSATPNIAHCTLGAGPATNSDKTIEAGGEAVFNVTSATQFSCVTSSGSQVLGAVAGSGNAGNLTGTGPTVTAPGAAPAVLVGVQGGGAGATPFGVKPGVVTPLSPSCRLTFTSSAVQTSTCAGGIPAGATYALICNEGVAARWRDDGTAPTAGIGQVLGTGVLTSPTCAGFTTTFSALQWIAESGSSILNISWYK